MNNNLETLQYPIGKFKRPKEVSAEEVRQAIQSVSELPDKIRKAIEKLDQQPLDTPYRPEGWTVRQVVHHVADSHMNAYMRFKLALTEDEPTIKPYDQAQWAKLKDSEVLHPEISLTILKGIHTRWVVILNSMNEKDWEKTFIHPEHGAAQSLKQVIKMYEWHGEHHLAHITKLKERMGW